MRHYQPKLAALPTGIPQVTLSSTLPVRFAAEFVAGDVLIEIG